MKLSERISEWGIALKPWCEGRVMGSGTCPFCKKVGFYVYDEKGFWWCYCCAQGGTEQRFLERIAFQ